MEWVKRMDKELRAPPENQPLQKCIFQHKVKIALTSEIKTTPLWTDQVERLEWRFEDAIKELSSRIDAMGKRKSPGNSPDRKPRKRNGRHRPYQGRSAPGRRENREHKNGAAHVPANRGQSEQQQVPQYNPHYPSPTTLALN